MNHPALAWLSAYHDGELGEERLRKVEAHLGVCELCRRDLQALRGLSVLVQENPPLPVDPQSRRFTSQVLNRLAKTQPTSSPWEAVLRFVWRLAPFAVLVMWAYFQAVLLMTSLLRVVLPLDLSRLDLLQGLSLFAPSIGLLDLIATVVSAILLWGWLASWWAYRQHRLAGEILNHEGTKFTELV